MHLIPSRFRLSTTSQDLESGQTPVAAPQEKTPFDAQFNHAPDSKVAKFRYMVGIHNDPDFEAASRPAKNVGLYKRIVENENRRQRQYSIFAFLINGALGLQLLFAAAMTAAAAGNGPRGAITAFVAMGTVLAGFLTFLKGSGLPNRIKYYRNEWNKVREYIEQRERDFSGDFCDLDIGEEIAIIEGMYEHVRTDIEANTPDSYTSNGGRSNKIRITRQRPNAEVPEAKPER